MLVLVESMTDKFSYRVVLCPFFLWPCFMLNMVVGGSTIISRAEQVISFFRQLNGHRTWDAWVSG